MENNTKEVLLKLADFMEKEGMAFHLWDRDDLELHVKDYGFAIDNGLLTAEILRDKVDEHDEECKRDREAKFKESGWT